VTEIRAYLAVAWALFLHRPDAADAFGSSPDDAKRSFAAAIVALPIYAGLLLIGPDAVVTRRSGVESALVHFVFYVLLWTVWPFVAFVAARLWGRRERYFHYLTAFNWSVPIQASIWLAAYVLIMTLGLEGSSARLTTVAAITVAALYHIHILREAMDLGTLQALGTAMVNLFVYQVVVGTHHTALLQQSGS
tara:strand:+ start:1014 stop:1589 length:576 start_codon:yes stop_codon:yes gene_type:complete